MRRDDRVDVALRRGGAGAEVLLRVARSELLARHLGVLGGGDGAPRKAASSTPNSIEQTPRSVIPTSTGPSALSPKAVRITSPAPPRRAAPGVMPSTRPPSS